MFKKLLLISAATLTLTACGDKSAGSFGVSLEKSETTSADGANAVTQHKGIDVAGKDSLSIKMDARVLLAQGVEKTLAGLGQRGAGKQLLKSVINNHSNKLESFTGSKDIPIHAGALSLLAVASTPLQGWPVDPLDKSSVRRMCALGDFAPKLAVEMIKPVRANSLKDPGEAWTKMIGQLESIDSDHLQTMWAESVLEAGSVEVQSDTASNEVSFRCGPKLMSWGSRGLIVSEGGIVTFGDGRIGGKNYDIAVESSITSTTGKKLSADLKDSVSQSERAKIDAGLKH